VTFEFATAGRIRFGPGVGGEAAASARAMGRAALLVTGGNGQRAVTLAGQLRAAELEVHLFAVKGEPTVETVREGVAIALDQHCDVVIAFGGGSALDAGKAIAALAANQGDPLDYLEVVGKGASLAKPSLPFIAIPTTAGTGTEVTRNAVIGSPAHGVKASLRSPYLLPRLALVDPELTYSLSPEITASTGLDALTQLIEPLVSRRANPFTDGICREGIGRVARSLRRAWACGSDAGAREDMALASLFGGVALANAGLGAVHGFAAPLGGMFPVAHGAVCAALLPHVMAMNIHALRQREPQHPALDRYGEIGRLVTGQAEASAEDAVRWVQQLVKALGIPGLSQLGIPANQYAAVVEKAVNASSMKGNPITLDMRELMKVLEQAS
jgi:alcohol dehydrogenase class IV